jgi:hypothetical protein
MFFYPRLTISVSTPFVDDLTSVFDLRGYYSFTSMFDLPTFAYPRCHDCILPVFLGIVKHLDYEHMFTSGMEFAYPGQALEAPLRS